MVLNGRDKIVSFTIQNVLIPVENGYETVDVQIEGDCLTAITSRQLPWGIAPQLEVISPAIDGQNKLLLPGFINAHTHSSEMWQRGLIPPVPLELWIAELYDFASI